MSGVPAPPPLLVTGATGTIGSHLVRTLSDAGHPVRALTRDPASASAVPGVTWVGGDLEDRRSLGDAFRGVDRVFLLTSNSDRLVRREKNALRAAREAGVAHVVLLSALGASDHSRSLIGMWHWAVEQALQASGMAWTILRPHHYMQNLLGQRQAIVREGKVRAASGEGEFPFIDTRDVAEVAAVALTEAGHAGRVYALTGPEALSYRDATRIVGEVLGRDLQYVAESEEEALRRMIAEGHPLWHAAAQLAIAAYQRAEGPTKETTDTVGRLLGKPARSFEQFARDHAAELGGAP